MPNTVAMQWLHPCGPLAGVKLRPPALFSRLPQGPMPQGGEEAFKRALFVQATLDPQGINQQASPACGPPERLTSRQKPHEIALPPMARLNIRDIGGLLGCAAEPADAGDDAYGFLI